jgi:hypothetical protein
MSLSARSRAGHASRGTVGQSRILVDELLVAVELVPEGGVIAVTVRFGVPVRIPLGAPLVGPDGTRYTAIDILVDELTRNGADAAE